ncbi:MAG: DegV family protein [Candidatus Odinarchaeota archaeon]
MKIGFVTDSMSGLPASIAQRYNISLVPGIIRIDGQSHLSSDVTIRDIEAVLLTKKIQTSASPAGEFYKVYQKLYDDVEVIFSIHCPSRFSAAIKAAKIAASRLDDPSRVVNFECGVAGLGMGLAVIAGSISSQIAGDIPELTNLVEDYCKKAQLLGTVDSFDYISKTGRVKLSRQIAGKLASTFKIKPVLAMYGTDISLLGLPRSREKAKNKLVKSLIDRLDQGIEPRLLGISHFSCLKEAEEIENKISEKIPGYEFIICDVDTMVAVNTGPGLILVAYFGKTSSVAGEKINV